MRCPYCNAEIDEDDVYCEECGSPIRRRTKKRMLPVFILIMILFLLIGLGICGVFYLNQEKSPNIKEEDSKHNSKEGNKSVQESDMESGSKTKEDNKIGVAGRIEETEYTITIRKDDRKDTIGEKEKYTYVIEDSDKKYLTDSDVQGLTLQEINYAKNEIFARHGRKFQSAELQRYFNSKSWYEGKYDPSDFDQHYSSAVLNDFEKKNADFLREVEFAIDPAGYQLDQ